MHLADGARGFAAEMRVNSALDDREERLRAAGIVRQLELSTSAQAPREPADASLARVARRRLVGLAGNDVIELHDHVGAEVALDLHHDLGREETARAVDVGLELDALLVDVRSCVEREDLKSAGVGEDRAVPAHERVESAHLAHDLVAGPQVQVIRVREDHRRAHLDEIVGIERLHRRESADRHERRRLDRPVRRDKNAGPRGAGSGFDLE